MKIIERMSSSAHWTGRAMFVNAAVVGLVLTVAGLCALGPGASAQQKGVKALTRNTSSLPPERKGPEITLVPQVGTRSGADQISIAGDGRYIATGGTHVILWNVKTGHSVDSRHVPSSRIAFVPGKPLLAIGKMNSTRVGGTAASVRLYDADTGKDVWSKAMPDTVWGVAALPGGKEIAVNVGGDSAKVLQLLSVENGSIRKSFSGVTFSSRLAFSPDGRWLAFSNNSEDGITLIDLKWNSVKQLPKEQIGDAIAFSADGKHLAVSDYWKNPLGINIFDVSSLKKKYRFDIGVSVSKMAYSPDGKKLAIVCRDFAYQGRDMTLLYDTTCLDAGSPEPKKCELGRVVLNQGGGGEDVAWAPNGAAFYVVGVTGEKFRETLRMFDGADGRLLTVLPSRARPAFDIKFTRDGRNLLMDGTYTLRVLDLVTGRQSQVLKPLPGTTLFGKYALSNDGRRLFVAREVADGTRTKTTFGIFDAPTGYLIRTWTDELVDNRTVAFTPDDRYVVAGGRPYAHVYDAQTGGFIRRIKGPSEMLQNLAVSPDGKLLAMAGKDETGKGVIIADLNDGREVASLKMERALDVQFSPDGSYMAVAFSRNIQIFKTSTWTNHHWSPVGGEGSVYDIEYSSDGKFILAVTDDGPKLLPSDNLHSSKLTMPNHEAHKIAVHPSGQLVASSGFDGTVRMWEAKEFGKEVARFIIVGDEDFITVTPDGYYTASRGALGGMAFVMGPRDFSFEQFDLLLNRPDIVAGRIGLAPGAMIESYRKLYQKRLKKSGFTEGALSLDLNLPEIRMDYAKLPQTTTERKLLLPVEAADPSSDLNRLNIWVNGVPVWGAAGMDLSKKPSKKYSGKAEIELSAGRNEIQASVINAKGLESFKDGFVIHLKTAEEKPDLYLVAVGVSEYRDSQYNLTYAAKDAGDVAAAFEGQASYRKVNLVSLTDAGAVREKILETRKLLEGSRVDDHVIVFMAGHGLLDKDLNYFFATSDMNFSNPSERGMEYEAIEGLLNGIPARRKLLLMDTCHSGEIEEEQGAPEPPPAAAGSRIAVRAAGTRGLKGGEQRRIGQVAALMDNLFADLRRGSGASVISSAGGAEYALESPEWRNGVFTYSLLNGLKTGTADKDGDRHIRVSELRRFVTETVRTLTAGRQTPTSRQENLSDDFTVY